MEVYAGRLQEEVKQREEKHPLVFLELKKEDFFSLERFAGEGNIGHMVEQVMDYGEGIAEV